MARAVLIHFAAGKRTVDQIPVEQLIGPAVVIDIRAQAAPIATTA
jgi:kynurenine formamidase